MGGSALTAISTGLTLLSDVGPFINLIVGLVHQHAPAAQAASPASGTGPSRFATVLGKVTDAIKQVVSAGQIAAPAPQEDSIKAVVQSVVTSMKMPGGPLDDSKVDPAAAPPAASTVAAPDSGYAAPPTTQTTQTIVLKQGQTLNITVG